LFSLGIMQGRLTEPKGRGIQFFPFDNWENEFHLAKKLGLNEIEFIFDYENYQDNPLWGEQGIAKLNELISKTGIKVNSICFDYFMRKPFYKETNNQESIRMENKNILEKIIDSSRKIKARLIEIPLVDNSSIKNDNEKALFKDFIIEILKNNPDILIGLETDFPPKEFLDFIKYINHPMIRANYDSGNSSGLGYDHYEEITTLNKYVENIHIKDRVFHGTTVKLGTGSADFESFFKAVKEIGYKKSFILQAARNEDGKESENIKSQIDFLNDCISKFKLEE